MNKRKSIAASFGLLNASLEEAEDDKAVPYSPESQSPTPPRVGAGVIGATQRALGEIRDERDRLKALLEKGAAGCEIDTALIDPSPFPDRLPDDSEEEFAAFLKSVEEEGQKIPVQLRPHPQASGRYQVIFGHRRVRAASELGREVFAIVADISDRDLIISQGIENAARQDLTWIERALFAQQLDDAGIRPRDIYATLSIDDAELARMRQVFRTVPTEIIRMIGRAPKIGRPRWVGFAKALKETPENMEDILGILSADRAQKMDSNSRFTLANRVLAPVEAKKPERAVKLLDHKGNRVADAHFAADHIRIDLAGKKDRALAAFLQKELPKLVENFLSPSSEEVD